MALTTHHPSPGGAAWLTRAAMFIAIILVIARATSLETLRDPFEISPGQLAPPRTLTTAPAVALDWLAFLPAILILVRRTIDREYRIHFRWSFIALAALAVLAGASAIWASDRFIAVIGSLHFAAGVAILWAAMQFVRSPRDLRLVAGARFALLLTLVAYGIIYRYVELPDVQRSIEQNWQNILTQRGWADDSFTAIQFKKKVLAGESVGFSASPNTFAAILVMLGIVSIGLVIQRWRDSGTRAPAILILLGTLSTALALQATHSKAAFATIVLAAICFAIIFFAKKWIVHHRTIVFASIVAVIFVGVATLISYGISHHNLHQDSLNFRWRYWTASTRLIRAHRLLGVGWNNFGDQYLAVREPAASEEIRDPHDILIRFASELGLIGAALAITWLLRMGWELAAPITQVQTLATPVRSRPLRDFALIAIGAMVVNIVASLDVSQDGAWVLLELMKRLLYVGLIFCALIVTTLRSFDQRDTDDRPAPWIRAAILIAIGMFLLHNTIDISFFETGPMWTFMLLCGAALGTEDALTESAKRSLVSPKIAIALAAVAWLAIGVGAVVPTAIAEAKAQAGDEALQANNARSASQDFLDAFACLPFSNSDYLLRAARAQIFARAGSDEIRATIDRALAADPTSPATLNLAAHFEMQQSDPSRANIFFERALSVDPNDVVVRLEYADLLKKLGRYREALEQYRFALAKNDQLDAAEPKRLPLTKLQAIRGEIDWLKDR